MLASLRLHELFLQRRERLTSVMREMGVPAVLTADPVNVVYATGARNMTVHGMTGPDRLVFHIVGGPTVLYEWGGCEHLPVGLPTIDEVRETPGLSAKKTPLWRENIEQFANEIASDCRQHLDHGSMMLAVERLDFPVTDALRACGIDLIDATSIFQAAGMIKQPLEIEVMRYAVQRVEAATRELETRIAPGASENEVWAEFHRGLIARDGEYVVARLLQSGVRTFPYFQESSDHVLAAGDLVCFDTDAVGYLNYGVDFSRTFLCGEGSPTPIQQELYRIAVAQLEHNAANLAAGTSFEDFARNAYPVPPAYRDHGYYQLAHGLGLLGGHPNIPRAGNGAYRLAGEIEPGMVLCVESYVGDPVSRQGVKLEDQFLIHATSVEPLSTYHFDARLLGHRPPDSGRQAMPAHGASGLELPAVGGPSLTTGRG